MDRLLLHKTNHLTTFATNEKVLQIPDKIMRRLLYISSKSTTQPSQVRDW